MGKGKNRSKGGVEDQYGEYMVSQDRDERFGMGRGGSMSGGGGAGGPSRSGPNVTFVKHVPKFLQAHAHLLGQQKNDETVVEQNSEDEKSDDEHDEAAAIKRALEENPNLLAEHPELHHLADKAKAIDEKELGNEAFSKKNYEKAIQHFTAAAKLDPDNEVYFSNRAAAYTALQRYEMAVEDAKVVVKMKPNWVKGYQRLGAAFCGLKDYSEARIAYERAVKLEPHNEGLLSELERMRVEEQKLAAAKIHKFKKRDAALSGKTDGAEKREKKQKRAKQSKLLSFDGDDGEEDE